MKGDDVLTRVADHAEDAIASRTYRDEAIREAYEAGCSLREIADAAGLSHAGVKKIIERA